MNATRHFAVISLASLAGATFAQNCLSFCSGENLGIGVQDSRVGTLRAPTAHGSFPSLGPAEFASAQAGPRAWTVGTYPGWLPASSISPSARWLNWTNSASNGWTTLYAFTFYYSSGMTTADFDLSFLVDNQMEGIYVNGNLLPGSTGGTYNAVTTRSWTNVAMIPHQNNTVYFNARDFSVASGIAYCGTFTPVPEPGTLLAVGAGVAGLIARRRRRRS